MMKDADAVRRILVAGATGTIGRAVVRRLVADGHAVTALLRPGAGETCLAALSGAEIVCVALSDCDALAGVMTAASPDVVISCIASRSGAPKDAEAIDFAANVALLDAAQGAGARQFILLSAICVQKPLLAFQHAKLAFEARLAASGIDYAIVRPTAFFKSLSGQVKRVKAGKPFLIFGDGELTRCKPISDDDLARFIVRCIDNPDTRSRIFPIGGPGPAISLREQGELLFELAGKPPRFKSVSPRLFTWAERVLALGAGVSGWFAEKAEYARIARYYATESMLVLDPDTGEYSAGLTPEYGSETLSDHYRRLLAES
ncbi:NAD(P)H-binding protein [Erythrobacter sanguineus]|uniref:Divinyl chlorophyllide a 8-vinyl-reductase, chloroplastic n=1 Tax=Erythrobacter sanguineus TaxID=198312 RepID=A0A1M7SNE0_9SPHN|nr:NAD(P)H-binding protein [Erythrobacter sanguineus]SHN59991.1 divinylchlorophyllide 8-vinylreductase [Erythrobacter sanguineus]